MRLTCEITLLGMICVFRVERKERARLKNVKFSGKGSDPKVRCLWKATIMNSKQHS